jgi:hypothetical protein
MISPRGRSGFAVTWYVPRVSPARRAQKNKAIFTSTRDLVAFMEDEYLSEITLDDLAPLPSDGTPEEVRFTWWLHGVGDGKRVPYRVRARGVTTFRLDGTRDGRAISVLPPDEAPGVHVVMEVPGRLELACAAVEIARGRAEGAPVRRAFTDYAYFTARGERRVSIADVLEALGVPPGARVSFAGAALSDEQRCALVDAPRLGPMEILVSGAPSLSVFWTLAPGATGFSLSVSRGAASGEAWRRAQHLPVLLCATEVRSAWEFSGTTADWARAIDAKVDTKR